MEREAGRRFLPFYKGKAARRGRVGSSHREPGGQGRRGAGVGEAEDTVGAQAGRQMCPPVLFRVEV